MTSLEGMRRELREKYERLMGESNPVNRVPDLERDLERWEEYWKEKLTVFAFAWIRPWNRDMLLRVRLLLDEKEIDWLEHIYPNWIVFVTTAEEGHKAKDLLREHSLGEVTIVPDPFG